MRSIQNIITDSKRDKQIYRPKTTLLILTKKANFKTRKTRTKSYHSHDVEYKIKLQNFNKVNHQNANATSSTKTIQEHNKNRDRHKMHKTRQVSTSGNTETYQTK